ncbi:hypothetical protein LEHPIFIF_00092 [Aeromonas phage avDM9-HANS]|nr:hypothetical protein LEHPIFIF_00092 [Aeromonas phage avDM9-HANS]
MKINTKSWHYRFLNSLDATIPESLCPYFWKVVFMMAVTSAVTFLITCFMWMIGDKVFTKFDILLDNVYLGAVVYTFVGLVICVSIVALIVGAIFGCVWAKENFKPPYKEEPLIITFIKNKKSKFCPHLEFVDMDEKE